VLRFGLVGAGDAGRHHARALTELAGEGALSLTAVCGRDPSKLDTFCRELGLDAATRFASLGALLDAQACDAVILATPDGLHASQAIRAAERGLHVLVEKPLALARSDGEAAIEAARAANVHLAVGYHLRHHAAHRLARAELGARVGTLRAVHARWAWPDPAVGGWRARGEAARFWSLAALGTHAIDLALFFTSSRVTRVAAIREPLQGADRAAEVSLAFESGVLAHVSCSVTHRALSRVTLTGDGGELELLGTLGARGDGELRHRPPRGAAHELSFERVNPYAAQLRDFARRAAGGFAEDGARLGNLDVLERIALDPQGEPSR